MQFAPVISPVAEAVRLDVLRQCAILDSPAESEFDDLAALAAQLCETPIALITLVDESRQWFKARVGLTAAETPREQAFCAHAIGQDGLFVVSDAQDDPRFADNPLVTQSPHIRFYAGAPLIMSGGEALGTLCVIDRRPRELTTGQRESLRVLSRQVVAQLESRRNLLALKRERADRAQTQARLDEREQFYAAMMAGASDGLCLIEPDKDDYRCRFANRALLELSGMTTEQIIGVPLRETLPAEEAEWFRALFDRAIETRTTVQGERVHARGEENITIAARVTPVFDTAGHCVRLISAARDVTDRKRAERALRKSNKRITAIMESMSDAFLALDHDWRFTYVNPRFERAIGRTRSALLGTEIWDVLTPEDNVTLHEQCLLAVEKQTALEFETQIAPGGTWLRVCAHPSQDGLSLYFLDISERKQAEENLRHSLTDLQKSLDGIVKAMAFALEMRDPYTAGHQRRVSALACAIGREMGFAPERLEWLRIGCLLHDTGKIAIPAEILSKPVPLSPPEMCIVQSHAQAGYDILKGIEFAPPIALIALQHHERLDGSGYPQGLLGEAIIPEARITAVADVVEAMASHRPYRAALGLEKALEEIMRHRGVRYCPDAVDACLRVFSQQGFDFDQFIRDEG